MCYRIGLSVLLLSVLMGAPGISAAEPAMATGGAEQCLGCHDFGPDSPVHSMLSGAHGAAESADTPMGQDGCEACHGPSQAHTEAPTLVSPEVSFGPRWTATAAAHDSQCLACHEKDVAMHWSEALHMVNNLTCVTCHDVHAEQDKVMAAETQGQVCTVCHKPQKDGIHGVADAHKQSPACTTCHNPHDGASSVTTMLDNRSQGCRTCHDLVQMSAASKPSDKAKSYHKVMTQTDRTCLDCHQGVAHGTAGDVAAMVPDAVTNRKVTLFFPGQSDTEWLLSSHPGSQPLRQGRNCQQCHRGEEVAMAAALGKDFTPNTRDLDVRFGLRGSIVDVTLSWSGLADDVDVALMWGDFAVPSLQRGGCFAACHSDMPGMTRDRGQQTGKYLLSSRSQQRQIGQPAMVNDEATLDAMLANGQFGELWRLKLSDNNLQTATVLSGLEWRSGELVSGSASYGNGRWTVKLQRQMGTAPGQLDFNTEGKYTFGIALHGVNNSGGRHWVSLPMTLSFQGNDTDFKTE